VRVVVQSKLDFGVGGKCDLVLTFVRTRMSQLFPSEMGYWSRPWTARITEKPADTQNERTSRNGSKSPEFNERCP